MKIRGDAKELDEWYADHTVLFLGPASMRLTRVTSARYLHVKVRCYTALRDTTPFQSLM